MNRTALVVPYPGVEATIRHLKRPALLFRRIAILQLDAFLSLLRKVQPDPALETEVEWLAKQGVVSALDIDFLANHFQDAADCWPRAVPNALEIAADLSLIALPALRLSKWIGSEGVLVSHKRPAWVSAAQTGLSDARTQVLQIVLGSFPEPDENTP